MVGRHTWGSLDYAKHKCKSEGDSCKLSASHIQKGRLKSEIEKLTLFEKDRGKVHLKTGPPPVCRQDFHRCSFVCKRCLARESFIHFAEREHILLILLMEVGLQDICSGLL